MKLTRVLLMFAAVLVLVFPVFAISAAEEVQLYLPLVLRQDLPLTGGKPVLKTPANSAALDTMIPTFSWSMGPQESGTSGCFTYSKTPGPQNCLMTFSATRDEWQQVLWDNLDPGQVYYWRVGVYKEYGNILAWSDEWSFTSAPAGGPVLAAPVPSGPPDNSSVGLGDVVLSWQPVTGAVEYRLTLHNITTSRYYGFVSPVNQVTVRSDILHAGDSLEWYVKARNAYAWGPYSPWWHFSVAAGTQGMRVEPVVHYMLRDRESNWIISIP